MIDFLIANHLLPASFLRSEIRRRLGARILAETNPDEASHRAQTDNFAAQLAKMPIDPGPNSETEDCPFRSLDILRLVRGPHLLCSCGWFERGDESLENAEIAMMRLQAIRAQFDDGQAILQIGAHYDAMSAWLGARYPRAQISVVCRSTAEAAHIGQQAADRSLTNVTALSADLNTFDAGNDRYDRIVAVEQMETLRNWPAMLERMARWLKPDGLCFLQICTHRRLSYFLHQRPMEDWLDRRLPIHELMPGEDLLAHFDRDLVIAQRWQVDGRHYRRTAQLWRENLEHNRAEIRSLIAAERGFADAQRSLASLRLQLLLTEERTGYAYGSEWNVTQYVLRRRK